MRGGEVKRRLIINDEEYDTCVVIDMDEVDVDMAPSQFALRYLAPAWAQLRGARVTKDPRRVALTDGGESS